MQQEYALEAKQQVGKLVAENATKLGAPIKITEMVRFKVGAE